MLKVVYKAPDELQARCVHALLQQSGVHAVIRSFQIIGYGNLGRMLYPNWGEVLVEKLDLAKASELIDGFFSASAVAEDEKTADPTLTDP